MYVRYIPLLILMTHCMIGYLVIDGYYRWEVAKRHQLKYSKRYVEPIMIKNEVIEAVFRADLFHRLNTIMTREEKIKLA
jgi:hypothetical protein